MKRAIAACFLVLAICGGFEIQAQTASPTPAQNSASAQTASSTSRETTEYTLPPDKLAKSKALYDIDGRLRIIGTVWGFVVLLGILFLGVVAKFRDWAERRSTNSFVQALAVIPAFIVILNVLDWPLAAYGHYISLQYGLSVQHWGSWFSDALKGLAISIVISTLALWLMIWIIRRSPRRWWFYFWLIAVPFIVFFAIITPVVIDPMFNKFEPLDKTNPQLVDAIETVLHRGGVVIPRNRMFLMKASEKVTTLNAYVTGFGPSKRVVVWDTTLQAMTHREIDFVFGHELGHYVLGHEAALSGSSSLELGREQELRELDANAKAVEILTRAGRTEEAALRLVYDHLLSFQRAMRGGSVVLPWGHRPPCDEIRDLLERFPAHAVGTASLECAPAVLDANAAPR